jgi:predicted ester cyclase
MADIEANKAAIRSFYDRSHAGDLAVYDEMLADNFENHGGPAGDMHGPEAFKQAYVGFATAFSDFNTTIDLIVAEGDLVVAYGVASGTHDGPFMGLPPTGRVLRWTGIAIYRFDDQGLIAERWQEVDALALMGQLGLLPPMPGGPPPVGGPPDPTERDT